MSFLRNNWKTIAWTFIAIVALLLLVLWLGDSGVPSTAYPMH